MTIDPFIAGVLTTIFAELIMFNIIALVSAFKKTIKSNKENNDGTNNRL